MTNEMYRTLIRHTLRDYDYENRLLEWSEESSNDQIDMEAFIAFMKYNCIPPFVTAYTSEDFPVPTLIIDEVVIGILSTMGIVNSRNSLSYNNGGVSVTIPDGGKYLQSLQLLYRRRDESLESFKNIKVQINIDNCWGGVSTEYSTLAC